MDLDYSKLSTKELEAIANNDYSKLSTRTLEALAKPAPQDKSAWEKFSEPLANMSWEDWRKKSIASPTLDLLQSILPGGTEEQYQQASARVREKGNEIVGGLANIVQNPVESAQKAYEAVTTNPAGVAGEMVKGAIYDPNLALMPGTGDMAMAAGRGAVRGAEAVGRGAKAVATAPIQTGRAVVQGAKDVAGGFKEGLRNPEYVRNEQTAFAPLQQTGYYPESQVKPFMEAAPENRPQMLGPLEQSLTPPNQLFNTTGELLAKNWGPVAPSGENLIPYQGQTLRAFGEQMGRDIANNPFKNIGLPSLGGAAIGGLVGGPVGIMAGAGLGAGVNPMLRAAELATLQKLGKTAGFVKGFPEELQAAKQLAGERGLQANMPAGPQLQYTPKAPAPGPVNPADIAAQEAKLQEFYQQQAALKQAEALKQQTRQKVDEFLAAKKQQQLESKPVETTPAPVAGPVVPEGAPELPATRWTPEERLAVERERLKQEQQKNPTPEPTEKETAAYKKELEQNKMTPAARGQIIKDWVAGNRTVEGEVLDTSKGAYGSSNLARNQAERLRKAGIDEIPVIDGLTSKQVIAGMMEYLEGHKPEMLKAKRGPKKKGPGNVSQMLTEDDLPKSYNSKEDFEKARSFSILKEEPHVGTYPQGDKIIHVQKIDYGNLPKDVTKDWDQTKVFATDKLGNRVPVGKDWTELDPEPLTSQLKRRFKKD